MRRLYDFVCPQGHVSERLTSDQARSIECEVCGEQADRVISAPRISLEGVTGHFPGAHYRWEARRNEKMAQEQRKKRDHGTYS